MVIGSILNPINSSMIAVALLPIGIALGAPPSETAWLVSGLYLATAIGQPVVGRLVDIYGPRPLYLTGAVLVGIAGLLGVLAPNLWVLVAARVLLGFGTCAGYPAAMSLIRSEATRTGVDSPSGILTVLAVSTQTIAVLGPTLGGLLIGVGGWRATLAVNLPLAVICLVLGALLLPRSPRRDRTAGLVSTVDPAGIVLFAAMLVALLLFLMNPQLGDSYLLVIVIVAGGGLAWWELRAATPFLDLRVLAGNVPLLLTYARTLLAYVVSYAFLYGYTQWLEEGRGLTPPQAGLILLPVFAGGVLVSTLTGGRPAIRTKLIVGAVVQLVACVMLLLLGAGSAIWLLIALSLLLGIPQGLIGLAVQNAVYQQADPARTGSSAGLLRTFLYLGAIVAAAANGSFLRDGASTAGLHGLAIFMVAVAVAFLAITVADRGLRRVSAASPDH
ncbi:MFS transporter [Pseudonocardia sp. GCM10023141]